jgi:soluble lytic murein transglycosylase-like protein
MVALKSANGVDSASQNDGRREPGGERVEERGVRRVSARIAAALATAAACAALPAPSARAEVRVEKLADGRVVVYNVPRGEPARAAGGSPAAARSAASAVGAVRPAVLAAPPARPATPRPEPATDPATLGSLIDRHSGDHGLDPRLVAAVIQVESAFNHVARSRQGAMGLMQLMPATAAVLAVSDPYDPDQNVRGGTAYLARLLDRYGGDLALALAAYNAGPEAVDRHGGVPPYAETREYVRRVLRLYDGREAILPASGRAPSPRLVRGEGDRLLLTNTAPY